MHVAHLPAPVAVLDAAETVRSGIDSRPGTDRVLDQLTGSLSPQVLVLRCCWARRPHLTHLASSLGLAAESCSQATGSSELEVNNNGNANREGPWGHGEAPDAAQAGPRYRPACAPGAAPASGPPQPPVRSRPAKASRTALSPSGYASPCADSSPST